MYTIITVEVFEGFLGGFGLRAFVVDRNISRKFTENIIIHKKIRMVKTTVT